MKLLDIGIALLDYSLLVVGLLVLFLVIAGIRYECPKIRGLYLALLMKKPYQLVHFAYTHFHGDLLQGASKRTAGKDRLFFN